MSDNFKALIVNHEGDKFNSEVKYINKDFVKHGVYVIDLSSEFRYEENIPLIIPEINSSALIEATSPILIANPNCSVSQLLIAIDPIHKKYRNDLLSPAFHAP